jgi:hypothetical protein
MPEEGPSKRGSGRGPLEERLSERGPRRGALERDRIESCLEALSRWVVSGPAREALSSPMQKGGRDGCVDDPSRVTLSRGALEDDL